MENFRICLIVTTYNWPQALRRVLEALETQSDQHFEIIIADDGSREDTRALIREFQQRSTRNIQHVWQEDRGFRAAEIRNKAALASTSDYFIFLDGDCLVLPDFVKKHRALSEKNYFVAGNRVLLQKSLTHNILNTELNMPQNRWGWLKHYMQGQLNRFQSLLPIPLGPFRKLAFNRWKGVKSCNLGVWRQDFFDVNGFDETFEGWGFEDSDLVIRLLHLGRHRKSARFAAPVIHLWHKENDRSRTEQNLQLLKIRLKGKICLATKGLAQHAQ